MDSTDCFLEILSAYQSSDSGCQVSLWSIAIVLALIIINSLAGIVITSVN